jgi:peptide/nickel transport system substrate-binding protein
LKPNIKFSDGTSYDADAVKFNWERIADPANSATRAASAQLIQSMEVQDPLTLKIVLKSKNAVFAQAVGQIPFVGSPAAIRSMGAQFGQRPVGAGAFLLNKWERDNQMVLVRNPGYWSQPRPYVDQLIVKPMSDEVQRTNTVLAGQANFTFVQTPDSVDRAESAGFRIYPQVINGGVVLHMNTKKAPFNDLRLRQAVAMAIDLKDYSKVVNNGKTAPMDSIFRPESPFYDPAILQQAYNPTRAQQLFNDVAADNKGTIEFKLSSFTAINYATSAQYIAGKLNSYKNVKVTLVPEAGTLHQQNLNSGNYDMSNTGVPIVDPEPAWTGLYTCDASPSPTGWCSAAFDAAVAENRTTLDVNKRIAALKDAQKEFYAQVPSLFIERRYNWLVAAQNLQDVQWVNDGLPLFDRIWLKR